VKCIFALILVLMIFKHPKYTIRKNCVDMWARDGRGAIEICLSEKGALAKKRLGNTGIQCHFEMYAMSHRYTMWFLKFVSPSTVAHFFKKSVRLIKHFISNSSLIAIIMTDFARFPSIFLFDWFALSLWK